MGLAAVALVAGCLVGYFSGGSWSRLAALRWRGRWLVGLAVLAQVGGSIAAWRTGAAAPYTIGLAVSALAALTACALNLRLAGLPLLTVGLLANAVVVAANGAMPVSPAAAARAGVSLSAVAAGTDPRHEVATSATRLRLIGDVVPVPLPGRPEVVSPGDVLVAAGLAELVVVTMRRSRRRAVSPVTRVRTPSPVR